LTIGALLLVALFFAGEFTTSNKQQTPSPEKPVPPVPEKQVAPQVISRKGPLRAEDIPTIVEAGAVEFDKNYRGKLYTAKMVVNNVMNRPSGYSMSFGEHSPITCNRLDPRESQIGNSGDTLWVSGIMDNLLGDTVFLDPCEISFTQEPNTVPRNWKTHPPRQ